MQVPISRKWCKSGNDLNFEVVGGTVQPENPKENTIWVEASDEITGWSFSEKEPTEPIAGMVWIKTGTKTGISFNALVEKEIILTLIYAQKFDGSTWNFVNAEAYQNGAWEKLWNGTLFDETGNQYEGITGGWVDAPRIAPSYNTIMPISIGKTGQSGDKTVISLNSQNTSGYRQSIAWTKEKVDTTGFSALEVDFSYFGATDYGTSYENYIRITTMDTVDWYQNEVILKKISGESMITCPIPDPGKYHIALSIVTTDKNGHVNIQVSGVRLVK